jgi:hypothetical protein
MRLSIPSPIDFAAWIDVTFNTQSKSIKAAQMIIR